MPLLPEPETHPSIKTPHRSYGSDDISEKFATRLPPIVDTSYDPVPAEDDFSEPSLIPILNALYLLSAVSAVSWGRFAPIYYLDVQFLTPSQIGIVEGVVPLFRMFSKPIWGILSDIMRCRRFLLLLTTALGNIFLMSFAFPSLVHGFRTVFFVSSIVAVSTNGGLLDAFAIEIVGTKRRLEYGRMRLYASIGWGVGNIAMGCLTDRFGFTVNFIWMGISVVGFWILLRFAMPERTRQEVAFLVQDAKCKAQNQEKEGKIYDTISPDEIADTITWSRIAIFLFFGEVFLMGVAVSVVERMVFVFLKDPRFTVNASTTLCGTSVAVSTLLEIPIFYFAEALTDRLGQNTLMMLATSGCALRTFLLTKVTSKNVTILLLIAESLHGVVFAGFWIVAVDRVTQIFGKQWGTTAQTVLQAVYGGLGAGIGSIAAGFFFEIYGPVFVYQIVSYCMVVVFTLRLIVTIWKTNRCSL